MQQDGHLDPGKRGVLFQEFADYLRALNPQKAAVPLDLQQREALFQEFAEYQKHQHVMIAYRYPVADH